jgi:hypothetical protein
MRSTQFGHSHQSPGLLPVSWPRAFKQAGVKGYLQNGSSSLNLHHCGNRGHSVFQDEQHIVARRTESSARWSCHAQCVHPLSESEVIDSLVLIERMGVRREPNPVHTRNACGIRRSYRKLLTVGDVRCGDRCNHRTNGR